MILSEYQAVVGLWHERHFGDVDAALVALKLCEETGELARCVVDRAILEADVRERVATEGVDVLVALLRLMDMLGVDADEAWARRWPELAARSTERARGDRSPVPAP